MREAGHYPQLRGELLETAFRMDEAGRLRAPVIQVFVANDGRWVLTGYCGDYYQVPDERNVPEAAVSVLRAMDYCMTFSPEAVQKYGLIELDPAEFEPDDE